MNEKASQDEANAPYVLAMVVCDAVWRDHGNGKCYVLGTFSTIGSTTFPAIHPILSVYLALTDGRGRTDVLLRLVDAAEEAEPLFESPPSAIDWSDPRMVAELVFQVNGVMFPGPGEYRLQVFSGTEPLMERRIVVVRHGA